MMGFEHVLTAEELGVIREFLGSAPFVDGKYSAAASVAARKSNLQLQPGTEGEGLVGRVVIDALLRNEVFRTWAKPLHLTPPIFARYQPGMRYGAHVDSAVLGGGRPLRSDLSITLFLTDGTDYDGGELEIEIPGGTRKVKLPAGSEDEEVTRDPWVYLWFLFLFKRPHPAISPHLGDLGDLGDLGVLAVENSSFRISPRRSRVGKKPDVAPVRPSCKCPAHPPPSPRCRGPASALTAHSTRSQLFLQLARPWIF